MHTSAVCGIGTVTELKHLEPNYIFFCFGSFAVTFEPTMFLIRAFSAPPLRFLSIHSSIIHNNVKIQNKQKTRINTNYVIGY